MWRKKKTEEVVDTGTTESETEENEDTEETDTSEDEETGTETDTDTGGDTEEPIGPGATFSLSAASGMKIWVGPNRFNWWRIG